MSDKVLSIMAEAVEEAILEDEYDLAAAVLAFIRAEAEREDEQ
jgi:hypothetical protein